MCGFRGTKPQRRRPPPRPAPALPRPLPASAPAAAPPPCAKTARPLPRRPRCPAAPPRPRGTAAAGRGPRGRPGGGGGEANGDKHGLTNARNAAHPHARRHTPNERCGSTPRTAPQHVWVPQTLKRRPRGTPGTNGGAHLCTREAHPHRPQAGAQRQQLERVSPAGPVPRRQRHVLVEPPLQPLCPPRLRRRLRGGGGGGGGRAGGRRGWRGG
jgi:hypothetical protein